MRTSNLVLIATVFVFGLASSTLKAQLLPRPFLNVSPQVYPEVQEVVEPAIPVVSNPVAPVYTANRQWYPYVIARPEDRSWIRATPVELRPNRPLHFWGNSRRRLR